MVLLLAVAMVVVLLHFIHLYLVNLCFMIEARNELFMEVFDYVCRYLCACVLLPVFLSFAWEMERR